MKPQFDTIPEQKIAYLVMRKCGCSSIRHAFSKIRDTQPVPSQADQIHSRHSAEVYADAMAPKQWFKFTIVRDPVMRFLSFYANKILDQNIDGNHTFQHSERFGYLPNMNLDSAISILVDNKFESEPHVLPQTEMFDAVGFKLDFIGKLETMNASLAEIENHSGVKIEVQHLNRAKQKPVLPTQAQFDAIADFYRRDIEELGYFGDYQSWYEQFVLGREDKFQLEPGFTFDKEAKLLRHSISKTKTGYVIQLLWRIHPEQFRKRVIRIIRKPEENNIETIWHMPPRHKLGQNADINGIVSEFVHVPFEKLPADADLTHVYHELYFTDEIAKRSLLTDYLAHDNMLIFPFRHLGQS